MADYYQTDWLRDRHPCNWRDPAKPLLTAIRSYDALRTKLETEGGTVLDLQTVAALLEAPIPVARAAHPGQISLADAGAVQYFLDDISRYTLHLQVRRDSTGLPLYYLARVAEDYWSYQLVVEDVHVSPGFPTDDERFVQLMSFAGHERQYLRLSALRGKTAALTGADNDRVDDLLLKVGRHVLAAAWHSDQRISSAIAGYLEAPEILHAVELLYLVLSGDLSSVRDEVAGDPLAPRFFEKVYPQPAIRQLLEALPNLDGNRLAAMPKRALHMYGTLTAEFNRFLRTPVDWGPARRVVPLYKLVLANWRRLHLVAPAVKESAALARAVRRLVRASEGVCEGLLAGGRALD
jgi:hypothetical protein